MPIVLVMFASIYLLLNHHSSSTQETSHIITVAAQPITSTLYYSGTIQPVKLATLSSTADGSIEKILFKYGEPVKEGQILFTVSSEKFHTDYKSMLMQYIKTKSDFLASQNQLNESTFLHHSHLISDNEFKSKKINFYNVRLEMLQSRASLSAMLRQFDLHGYNIYDLKIEDIDKITYLLQAEDGSQRLKITAPTSGIMYQPPKGDTTDGELKKIMRGDQIKVGDVLGVIGDTNSLIIHINVSEFNINQIKSGQKVKITSIAIPTMVLDGEVTNVNRQGESGSNGVPTFPVDISITHLSPEQRSTICVGMSVKVAINVVEDKKIIIPINAVTQRNDEFYVKVQDAKSGKTKEVAVKLGKTIMDSVIVESNLNTGEKIVVAS